MTISIICQKGKPAWTPDPGRRRSMLVLLSVRFTPAERRFCREGFAEETRTLVVNAHGALISLAAHVAAAQTITISNKATQQTMDCRVVYVGNPQGGKSQIGVEFAKPSPSLWQIDFLPDDWVVPEN